MRFSSLLGNSQKLDGGAMFGNAPRAMWSQWIAPDALNRIPLATRCLLVETPSRKILLEAGIGAYMAPKYRERYGVQETQHVLLASLAQLSLAPSDITDIILSHLHFDHAGGLLSAWEPEQEPQLLFPQATYYVGAAAWQRAEQPHPRDRASFIPQLNALLAQSGHLVLLQAEQTLPFDDLMINFFHSEGHTPGLLCSDLRWQTGRLIFVADLIPGRAWVHLPITMGYDRFPEQLINEKQTLLSSVVAEQAWLFYTHDPEIALSKVTFDEQQQKFIVSQSVPQLQRALL